MALRYERHIYETISRIRHATSVLLNIRTLAIDTIACVESYIVSKEGNKIAYVTKPDKKDSVHVRGVFVYDPATKTTTDVLTGEKEATFKTLSFND